MSFMQSWDKPIRPKTADQRAVLAQFAALHARAPRGCTRVGGENRVPRIPLYVSDIMPKVSPQGKAVDPILYTAVVLAARISRNISLSGVGVRQ